MPHRTSTVTYTDDPTAAIPDWFGTDYGIIVCMTLWRNAILEYRAACHRVYWYSKTHKNPSSIEKKRRAKKWIAIARMRDIERTIIFRNCAMYTHHPDIWSSKKADGPESRHRVLLKRYYLNRKRAHMRTGKKFAARNLEARKAIVAEIRALERKWMVAVYAVTHPGSNAPLSPELHPSELVPRKVRRASRYLHTEAA